MLNLLKKNKISVNNPKYYFDYYKLKNKVSAFENISKQIIVFCDIYINELTNQNYFMNANDKIFSTKNDLTKIVNLDSMLCEILSHEDKISIINEMKKTLFAGMETFSSENVYLFNEIKAMYKKTNEVINDLNSDLLFCTYLRNAMAYKDMYIDLSSTQYDALNLIINNFNKSYTELSYKFLQLQVILNKIDTKKMQNDLVNINSNLKIIEANIYSYNMKWDNLFDNLTLTKMQKENYNIIASLTDVDKLKFNEFNINYCGSENYHKDKIDKILSN